MGIIEVVVLSVLCLMVAAISLQRRNVNVYTFRVKLIDAVAMQVKNEIAFGAEVNWQQLFDATDAISYDRMLWMFWRPLESFYEGTILEDMAQKIACEGGR